MHGVPHSKALIEKNNFFVGAVGERIPQYTPLAKARKLNPIDRFVQGSDGYRRLAPPVASDFRRAKNKN